MTYTIQDNIAVVKFDQKDSKVGIQKLLASVLCLSKQKSIFQVIV